MATAAKFKQTHFLTTPSKASSIKGEFLDDVFLLSGSEFCPRGRGETFAYTDNTNRRCCTKTS